jgi:hypothetical protein
MVHGAPPVEVRAMMPLRRGDEAWIEFGVAQVGLGHPPTGERVVAEGLQPRKLLLLIEVHPELEHQCAVVDQHLFQGEHPIQLAGQVVLGELAVDPPQKEW